VVLKWGLTIPTDDMFESGSAILKPNALKWVTKLSKELAGKEYSAIRINGHTDNAPIVASEAYPSNWELSIHRATNIVKYMITLGFDPAKLYAVGYGETHPRFANTDSKSMKKNRRVEMIIEK
jgi:chemotaxis protein MotB